MALEVKMEKEPTMYNACQKFETPSPDTIRLEPDLRLCCKINSQDYVELYLRVDQVTLKAYYSFLEGSPLLEQHSVALTAAEVKKVVAFLKSDVRCRPAIGVDKNDMHLSFASDDKGGVSLELSKQCQLYSPCRPTIMLSRDASKALLSSLKKWLRDEGCQVAEPTFGLV